MTTPTMLYRAPGLHAIHGHMLDYCIVDADTEELKTALNAGWHLTTTEAADAAKAPAPGDEVDDSPATRAELEQKAQELGLAIDRRWSDKTLSAKIEALLKE